MIFTINNSRIKLTQGDITESRVEAIINAANSDLTLGAGVAGAIRKKGGPSIQEECDVIGHCPVGQAVITGAGDLYAKYVIHTVGPRKGEPDADVKLKSATLQSLKRAEEFGIPSIAFPAISTGIFGFPVERCAELMLNTTVQHLSESTGIGLVQFVLFDSNTFQVFCSTLEQIQIRE